MSMRAIIPLILGFLAFTACKNPSPSNAQINMMNQAERDLNYLKQVNKAYEHPRDSLDLSKQN